MCFLRFFNGIIFHHQTQTLTPLHIKFRTPLTIAGLSNPPKQSPEAWPACLQEKAEEFYRLYQSSALSSHPVVALAELRSLFAGLCPDERTFYLLLLQLQKEKRVTILEQNGEKVQGPGDCFWVVSSLSCLPACRGLIRFG